VTSNSIVGHETSAETPFFALQSWFAGFQAIPRTERFVRGDEEG
jgi:hypothetical protein